MKRTALQLLDTAPSRKTRRTSVLEGIAGVGPKRRRELLKYFGGLQELSRASVEEIAKNTWNQ